MLIKSFNEARRDRLNSVASAAVTPIPGTDGIHYAIEPDEFERLMTPVKAYVERAAFRSLTAVDRQREVPDICQDIYLALVETMMRRGAHPPRVDGSVDADGNPIVTPFANVLQLKTNNLLTNFIRDLTREGLIERLPASEDTSDVGGAITIAPEDAEAAPEPAQAAKRGRKKRAKYQYRHREHLTAFDAEGPDAALVCRLGVTDHGIEEWEQTHLLEQLTGCLDRDDRRRLKFWLSCDCNTKKYARAVGLPVGRVRTQIDRIIEKIRQHHKIRPGQKDVDEA